MDELGTTTPMQPDHSNTSVPLTTAPAAQIAQPEIIVGSQLAALGYKENATRKKKYIVLAIALISTALLGAVAWILFTNQNGGSSEDVAGIKTASSSVSTKPSQSVPSVTQPQQPKYRDIDYSTETYKYKINYLNKAQVLSYCEIGVGKYSCHPPVPSTLYLGASINGRPTLLFSITEDPKGKNLSSECKTAFTVVLNEKQTDVCKVNAGNGVLYYGFAFTIKGARQVGTFIMDNQKGVAYYDTSVYETEIKEIIPTIRVYL